MIERFVYSENQTKDVIKQNIFTKIFNNKYCTNTPVVARYEVRGLSECSKNCLETPDCTMFMYGKRNDSNYSDLNQYYCDVTGTSSGNVSYTSSGGTDWSTYTID